MSSKDRKHSRIRTSEYGDNELSSDRPNKKSSSKNHPVIDKDLDLEYKYKINNSGELGKEDKQRRRVKEEYLDEKGKLREFDVGNKLRQRPDKNDEINERDRAHRKRNEDEVNDLKKNRKKEVRNNEQERREKMEPIKESNELKRARKKEKDEEVDDRERRHAKEREKEARKHRKDNEDELGERERQHKRNKEAEFKESSRHHRKDREEESNEGKKYHRRGSDSRREDSGNLREKDREKGRTRRKQEKDEDNREELIDRVNIEGKRSDRDVNRKGGKERAERRHRIDGERESEDHHRANPAGRQEERDSWAGIENEVAYDDDFENYDEEAAESSGGSKGPAVTIATTDTNGSKSRSNQARVRSPSPTSPPSLPSLPSSASSALASVAPAAAPAAPVKPVTKIGQFQSSFINFRIAQQKYSHDLVANRMLARAFDLSRLIELDRVEYDIIEMAPVIEHSQYMRLFGRSGCIHEGSQTGSDNVSRDTQTELIDERVVWTQCPPLDDHECVQIVCDNQELQGSHVTDIYRSDGDGSTAVNDEAILSSILLMDSLVMIETVLEEEAWCNVNIEMSHSQQVISKGYSKFSMSDGIDCLIARFAGANSNIFATVHQASKIQTHTDNKQQKISPIAIWKVSRCNGEPFLGLACPGMGEMQSTVSQLTFSADPAASHVICGLSSGALALWDLRENSYSRSHGIDISPAYLTSASTEDGEFCHKGPIVGLQPIINGADSNSYQLISLDSFGQVLIWMVSHVSQINQWNIASGSLTDLNLRPGARYRLSRVASMNLVSSVATVSNPYVITSVAVNPSCSSHLFCGTNTGQIISHKRAANQRITSSHSISQPRSLGGNDIFETGTVTQLDFYPFFEPYLLAGYDDGTIRIFAVGRSTHLLAFHHKPGSAILQLKWSRSHPAIFFSLDVEGNLCAWNILLNQNHPLHVQSLPGYIGFDVSSDSKWEFADRAALTASIHVNNKARLLLWALDGRVEVHELSDAFSNPELDDSFKASSLFQSLI